MPEPPRPARDWEAILGGNILNAAGGIVLVIGIALFLAYSMAHLTAAGRAGMATAASIAMLGSGIWLERKQRYRIFARGLIAAGWASLYATSYAIYALPAARILPNAAVGSVMQLLVALGMVGHSLRYRWQALTAIAYAAVFCALAVTPSTPFAVVTLIPIAASALYLATRFDWDSLPVFCLAATYLTCISRGESGAPLASTQALFLAYWLLFEIFDLRRVRLGRVAGGLEYLFPLNAFGFLASSALAWQARAPGDLWLAAVCGAGLYLASAAVRMWLRAGMVEPDSLFERLRLGTYEASLAVAAGLGVFAICSRAPGMWAAAWLASEAELVYLAGIRFGSKYLRAFAAALFWFSLGRLAYTTEPGGSVAILGREWRDWTPPAIFHAAIFYCNRMLRPSDWYYSYAGSIVAAVVVFAEVPHAALGFAWALIGYALLELALRTDRREFEIQAYALMAAAACAACIYPFVESQGPWLPLAGAIAVFVAATARTRRGAAGVWLLLAASCSTAALLWRLLPEDAVALGLAALALAIEICALLLEWPAASWQAAGAAALAMLTACGEDLSPSRLVYSVPTAAAFFVLLFLRRSRQDRAALYYSLLGTALGSAILGFRVSGGLMTVAWGLLGLCLLGAGFGARVRYLRLEGLALFFLCILKLFVYDLRNLETFYRILSFVALGLILLAVSWIYTRFREQIERLL